MHLNLFLFFFFNNYEFSYDESTEWTCVHDIQDMPLTEKVRRVSSDEDDTNDVIPLVDLPNPLLEDLRRTPPPIPRRNPRSVDGDDLFIGTEPRRSNIPRVVVEPPPPSNTENPTTNNTNNTTRRRRRSEDDENDDELREIEDNGGNNAYLDIWAAAISIQHRNLRNSNMGTFNSAHVYGINSGIITSKLARQTPQLPIAQNTPRLMYFKEEPSKGKGFIKELCFSSDGKFFSYFFVKKCKNNTKTHFRSNHM